MSPENGYNPQKYLASVPGEVGDATNKGMKQEFQGMRQNVQQGLESEQSGRQAEIDRLQAELDRISAEMARVQKELVEATSRMQKLGERLKRGDFRKVETIIQKEEEYGALREQQAGAREALDRLMEERNALANQVESAINALENFQENAASMMAEAMGQIGHAEEMRRVGENFESFDRQQKRFSRQLEHLRSDLRRNAEEVARIVHTSKVVADVIGDVGMMTPEQIVDLVQGNLETIRERALSEDVRLVDRRELMGFWSADEPEGGLVGLMNMRRAMRDQEGKLSEMEAVARLEAEKALRILNRSFAEAAKPEDLGAGGGLPLPTQPEGGDSTPLGEHSAEEQAVRDAVEQVEQQQAAGAPAVENIVNDALLPELPTIPVVVESNEGGVNMDNEGRIENPIPVSTESSVSNDLGVQDESEAETTQAVATGTTTPELPRRSAFDQQFSRQEVPPGTNRDVMELGLLLGGIPDALVRQAVRDMLRSRPTSETGSDITDELVDRVAGMALDTANRLGYKPNPGESAVDFLNRVNEESERRNMSLMERIRAAMPRVEVRLPSLPKLEFRIGASPEEKRATIESRLTDIAELLRTGDFPEAYSASGMRRELSQAERGDIRRRLEAERDQLQKQLDALPKAEGQSGGVETERRSWLKAGVELWRKFKEGQITRRTEKETARKLKEEATGELGRRLDQIGALNQRVAEFANRGELYVAGAIQALLNAYRIFFDVAGLDPEKRRAYADILGRSGDEIPVVVKAADGKGLELRRIDLSVDTSINEVRDALGVSLRSIRESSPFVPLKAGETRQMTRGQVDLQGVMASTASLEDRFGKEVTDILNAL